MNIKSFLNLAVVTLILNVFMITSFIAPMIFDAVQSPQGRIIVLSPSLVLNRFVCFTVLMGVLTVMCSTSLIIFLPETLRAISLAIWMPMLIVILMLQNNIYLYKVSLFFMVMLSFAFILWRQGVFERNNVG